MTKYNKNQEAKRYLKQQEALRRKREAKAARAAQTKEPMGDAPQRPTR